MRLVVMMMVIGAAGGCVVESAEVGTAELELGAPFKIYMRPGGATSGCVDDGWVGRSYSRAVGTLACAQAILRDAGFHDVDRWAAEQDRNVEVRISPVEGTYDGQSVVWTTTNPDYAITFLPILDDKNRPVFHGGGTHDTWFALGVASGQDTNLHFRYLRVESYRTAMDFRGNRNSEAGSNGNNSLYGMYFKRIGSKWIAGAEASTGAVILRNSDDNRIENSHFIDIQNSSDCGLLHALYLAHMSDDNYIRGNRIVRNCGDPIRLRDFSNRNVIRANEILDSGSAAYTDWYCDWDAWANRDCPRDGIDRFGNAVSEAAEACRCTKATPECPSWENEFRDNHLGDEWDDGLVDVQGPLSTFEYYQDGSVAGCTPLVHAHAPPHRLHTSGNFH